MESTDARALSSDCTNATGGIHKRYSKIKDDTPDR